MLKTKYGKLILKVRNTVSDHAKETYSLNSLIIPFSEEQFTSVLKN